MDFADAIPLSQSEEAEAFVTFDRSLIKIALKKYYPPLARTSILCILSVLTFLGRMRFFSVMKHTVLFAAATAHLVSLYACGGQQALPEEKAPEVPKLSKQYK